MRKKTRFAVYTGIFGNYDSLPAVEEPREDMDYICFTDAPLPAAGPWRIKRIPRVLADPHRDSRRVKLLPHLFLPEYDASLWVDANFTLKKALTREYLDEVAAKHCFAALPHQERDCAYQEASVVLLSDFDAPQLIRQQMHKYRSLGFPENFGLHAGGFLVRRHNEARCKVFCDLWWKELSLHSRRDQLSLPFVRWATQQEIGTLPVSYLDNPFFTWGVDGSGGHRFPEQLRRDLAGSRTSANAACTYAPEEYGETGYLLSAKNYHDILAPCAAAQGAAVPLPEYGPVAPEIKNLFTSCRCVLFVGDISPLWLHYAFSVNPDLAVASLSRYTTPEEKIIATMIQQGLQEGVLFIAPEVFMDAREGIMQEIDGVMVSGDPDDEVLSAVVANSRTGTTFIHLHGDSGCGRPIFRDAPAQGLLKNTIPGSVPISLYLRK